jgi:Asp-tRNA(Asn)/Glu-tRNA(Gln) amidotransferase A subunit family amidase
MPTTLQTAPEMQSKLPVAERIERSWNIVQKRRCVQPDEPSSRLDPLRHGDGLPAGIMLVGSRGDDETVLALASQFEPLGLSDEDSFAAPPFLILTIIGWGLIPTDPQFQVASHNKNERD